MFELQGKYNTAKVFTDNLEEKAIAQIINLLNQEFVTGSKIRIMPDAHAGAGCTIGTTMTIIDKIVPNLVGVDIGCGMETVILKDKTVNLQKLDDTIHKYVPASFNVRRDRHPFADKIDLTQLRCQKYCDLNRAYLSIGTLGGGNHFIEMGQDTDGNYYLVAHSGSRNVGKQVADHYQNEAYVALKNKAGNVTALVEKLTKEGREKEIQTELQKVGFSKPNKELSYVEGQLLDDYLHDMSIMQQYANLNRKAIIYQIMTHMRLEEESRFTTIHNYIDIENMTLRKGAISAKVGETVLIPMNMRDGSLLCIGKGDDDWNSSAPHGAGRIMSRSAAKRNIALDDFKATMDGVYSSTIDKSTIDEAPMAYKPMDEIVANIGDTVDIISVIKPLYNFKAAE